ncbi:MAG: hypothetical protein ACRDRK_27565 [Pseudonocardia sp.]
MLQTPKDVRGAALSAPSTLHNALMRHIGTPVIQDAVRCTDVQSDRRVHS